MLVQRLGTTEGMSVPGMKTVPIISYALVHNDVVSLCGIPGDPAGDVKAQTRQVLERIDQLLQMAGTDKSKLLVAQVWLADMSDFDDHNAVWNDYGSIGKILRCVLVLERRSGTQACALKLW